tara:strand:+ start:37 stop:303 length:267 start_codon:yes stop_codon:yes gene_type:complete
MDLLKLEEDISERLMIELGDELRTEYLTFATTFVMEEIKKHLEVKNNSINRSKKQNERMRKWFEERTGLKDALLIEHMNRIDEMLNVV